MKNELMTEEDVTQFKALFRKYCRGEINAGRCSDDSCDPCYINKAYMEIFDSLDDGDDDEFNDMEEEVE